MPPDYEKQLEICAGSYRAAAMRLGMRTDHFRRGLERQRKRRAAERGELGYKLGLPGFVTKQISAPDGDAWVKQVKEPGEVFAVPKGQKIKGVSALVDAEGREVAKWIKTKEDEITAEFTVEQIKLALDAYTGRGGVTPCPTVSLADLLTTYVLGDHHLSLLSWRPETGADYDLKIAEQLLIDSMDELVARTPCSETAIFENLGDFFHSNSSKNETFKGTPVDVDGRYGKILQVGLRLAVSCIEKMLHKHKRVIVAWLLGNHDKEIAMSMMLSLWAWFRNEPRVEIDFDPSKFFVYQHGNVMHCATHGDTMKPKDFALFAAEKWPKIWGDTTKRYAHFGHVHHHAKGGTAGSMIWESFETLAAKDAWHAAQGYMADRSMSAVTYHKITGWWSAHRVSVA